MKPAWTHLSVQQNGVVVLVETVIMQEISRIEGKLPTLSTISLQVDSINVRDFQTERNPHRIGTGIVKGDWNDSNRRETDDKMLSVRGPHQRTISNIGPPLAPLIRLFHYVLSYCTKKLSLTLLYWAFQSLFGAFWL